MVSEIAPAQSVIGAAVPRVRRAETARTLLRAGSLLAFVAVFITFGLAAPGFLNAGNLANIVGPVAVIGVLALGMTLVVVGGGNDVVRGGIDLSLANNLGLCAAVYAVLLADGHALVLAANALFDRAMSAIVGRLSQPETAQTTGTE